MEDLLKALVSEVTKAGPFVAIFTTYMWLSERGERIKLAAQLLSMVRESSDSNNKLAGAMDKVADRIERVERGGKIEGAPDG